MKRIISILTLLVLLVSVIPMHIQAGKANQIILNGGYVATVVGYTQEGKPIFQVDFSAPTYCDDLKTPIDTQWYEREDGSFVSGDNKFESDVSNEKIKVAKGSEYIEWTPEILLSKADKGKDLKLKSQNSKPEILEVDPMNENYARNTLVWHYDNGVDRYFRLIEGQCQEYFVINEPLQNDLIIDPKAAQTKDFKYYEKAIAYDEVGTGIKLTEDEYKKVTLKSASAKESSIIKDKSESLKELYKEDIRDLQQEQISQGLEPEVMYPLVIDPNYTFTSSASDGDLYWYDGVYNTTWTSTIGLIRSNGITATVGQTQNLGGVYYDYRSVLVFDTSILGSSVTITDVDLKLYGYLNRAYAAFNITAQQGSTTYPHDPIVAADYNKANYSTTSVGVLATASWSVTDYCTLSFDAADFTMVNQTGSTKLLLRSSRDIAGTAPSDEEYVVYYTYEKGTGYWPQLVVTFTADNPAITALAASNIAKTTARLNALITDDGGEVEGDTEVRFGYGTTTQAAVDFEDYDTVTAWVDGYGLGNPNAYVDASSLTHTTDYYYRAQVKNSTATVTSTDEIEFTTLTGVNDVSIFNGYPDKNSISLSWGVPSGAGGVLVRYNTNTYPSTTADGYSVYSGSLSTTEHSSLSAGTTYYYSIWGESGGDYSSNAKNLVVTTLGTSATTIGGGDSVPTPDLPASFFQVVDPTKLEKFEPFYSMINNFADSWGMPDATMWLIALLFIIAVIGFLVLIESQNLAVALVVASILMIGMVFMQLLPAYFVAIAVIFDLGAWGAERTRG